jgi:hypothetical protein
MPEPLVHVGFLLHGAGACARGIPFHAPRSPLKHGFYGEGFEGKPYWPGGASGVTLDYGYDLAHHSVAQMMIDWVAILGTKTCNLFTPAIGKSGAAARALISGLRDRGVTWTKNQARAVFESSILPRYTALTDAWVPGWRALPVGTRTALLSLAINRGTALRSKGTDPFTPTRRDEMGLIPQYVATGDLPQIAALIRSQKALWLENVAKDDDALAARREAEALLVESDYPKGAAA